MIIILFKEKYNKNPVLAVDPAYPSAVEA